MQAMHLVLAAVTLLQHPRKPSHDTRALVIPDLSAALVSGAAVADLQGLQGLASLQGMEGLAGLDGLAGLNDLAGLESLQDLSGLAELTAGGQWDVVPPVGWAQGDPADSLWRAARRAFNRGDYASAGQRYHPRVLSCSPPRYHGGSVHWAGLGLARHGGAR